VTDYFLEYPYGHVDLQDYYHVCRRSGITGAGEIAVFPSGQLKRDYLGKLARAELEPPIDASVPPPLLRLLDQIRAELSPRWILLDARTGLSESTGMLLNGLAHLYVLFGTTSEQSWQGLRLILERLGGDRVIAGKRQLECILVQALVPDHPQIARIAVPQFRDRARDEFADHYYAPDPQDPNEDRFWYVRDLEDDDAPHSPAAIPYQTWLSHFNELDEVADKLAELPEYKSLAARIAERVMRSQE
jgi:hypothetical protein